MSLSKTDVAITLPMFQVYCEKQFEQMNKKLDEKFLALERLIDQNYRMLVVMGKYVAEQHVKAGNDKRRAMEIIIDKTHEITVTEFERKAADKVTELIAKNKILSGIR